MAEVTVVASSLGGDMPNQTVLPDGNVMVVWVAQVVDDAGNATYQVMAQAYDPDGAAVGAPLAVTDVLTTVTDMLAPTVTVLENGSLVFGWAVNQGSADGRYELKARIFTEDGSPATGVIAVNTLTSGEQRYQSVAALDNGGFVVTYNSGRRPTDTEHDGSGNAVRAQAFDAAGNPVGAEFIVNTTTEGNQNTSNVAAIGGGYVVTFMSQDGGEVRARLFANDGTPAGPDFVLSQSPEGDDIAPYVKALPDGGFVALWSQSGHDETGEYLIQGRLFDASGAPAGDEFSLPGIAGRGAYVQDFVILPDGRMFLTYAPTNDEVTFSKLFGQVLSADGTPQGDPMPISSNETGSVGRSQVEVSADGTLYVTWVHYEDNTLHLTTLDVPEVVEVNHPPADLALSASSIAENSAAGTVIGVLSATDPDGDTLTYSLDDDADGRFSLVNEGGETRLVVAGALDHEAAASHDVVVKVSDGNGGETTKTFTIGVTDVNEAPTDIAISNDTISEAARAGSVLGVLSATDPDGDAITWSLVAGQGDNDNYFTLRTNDDGTVSVVLKAPLDFEGLSAADGVYDLVVKATDSAGNETVETIEIQSTDELMLMAASPTGKNYVSVVESAASGTEIGFFVNFDDRSTPLTASLVDDADGMFAIKTRVVDGVTRHYLVTKGMLDHETEDLHSVTVRATDANGNVQDKTYEVHVLDAAEQGDTARGRITIDAATALAKANGGVNWNIYIDAAYHKVTANLPAGVTFAPETSEEYVYTYDNGAGLISLKGTDLAYWWSDPESGEDVHVVGGTVTSLTFGNNAANVVEGSITNPELSITGLDLANGSALLDRIYGEANAMASAWMHGADGNSPAEIEFVKALLASYAQDFIGSKGNDKYTGTIFDDTVDGGAGKDVLKGGAGADLIDGGKGIDKLYGNGGADTFVFDKGDTGKTRAKADTIFDFKPSQGDVIDLSDWDANSKRGGDQDFTFIGSQGFHGKAGELRFVKEKSDTWIMGDTNGDGKADFMIHLDDAVKLKVDHFDL